jgi:cell division septum initiation protein DivIVA
VTEALEHRRDVRRSPHTIRRATFSRERKGWSTDEVREYLRSLADQIEAADAERTRLRAELDRQRIEVQRLRDRAPTQRETSNEPDAHAVALFSQAQQVADRLIEEAVQQARELMSTARKQQRDILQQAHSSAEYAMHTVQRKADQVGGSGYESPVPEIEYVRTFAQVAQVQLRSVLDALTEQVDRLGSLPDLERSQPASQTGHRPEPGPDTSSNWRLGLRELESQTYGDPRRGSP